MKAIELIDRKVGLLESGNEELIPLCVLIPITGGSIADTTDQCIRNLLAAAQRKGQVDSIDLVLLI
jgi:hypothetical protein